jgi:hypothetical protein
MHEFILTQKDAMIFTSITTFDWVVERIMTQLSPPFTFDWVVERITTQLSPPFTFEDKEKEDKKFTLIPCDKFLGSVKA